MQINLICHVDNPEILKIALSRFESEDKARILFNRVLPYVYYGSNIFNYIITNYGKYFKDQIFYGDFNHMIRNKALTDFAGLAVIFGYLSKDVQLMILDLGYKQTYELKDFERKIIS